MRPTDETRIRQLLRRLEDLEAKQPRPEEAGILAVARNAIVDEVTRMLREDWLAVYRRGDTADPTRLSGAVPISRPAKPSRATPPDAMRQRRAGRAGGPDVGS